ncbi:MAG: threonine dehydratase [Halieaceae bacterium]
MLLPDLEALEAAAAEVYQYLQPTPQLQWPLLNERLGCELWVKHENHNPTGAFKIRGGLLYMSQLTAAQADISAVIAATRGNHGQSIAWAAGNFGLESVIVVPEGNNPDKNRAMQAMGAKLIVQGSDFNAALDHAILLAEERDLHKVPSFHPDLVAGVASYALELLKAQPDLERIYVPIGLGSGICGTICARNALGLSTEIIGVVASGADCYARSLQARKCCSTESANTLADGLAVRIPDPEALAMMLDQVSRVVSVSDDEILQAIKYYFTDSHNIAEGAGAAALAAAMQEAELNRGARIAVILSGGNLDASLYCRALAN